jgi:hypothetical protein
LLTTGWSWFLSVMGCDFIGKPRALVPGWWDWRRYTLGVLTWSSVTIQLHLVVIDVHAQILSWCSSVRRGAASYYLHVTLLSLLSVLVVCLQDRHTAAWSGRAMQTTWWVPGDVVEWFHKDAGISLLASSLDCILDGVACPTSFLIFDLTYRRFLSLLCICLATWLYL